MGKHIFSPCTDPGLVSSTAVATGSVEMSWTDSSSKSLGGGEISRRILVSVCRSTISKESFDILKSGWVFLPHVFMDCSSLHQTYLNKWVSVHNSICQIKDVCFLKGFQDFWCFCLAQFYSVFENQG